jgi:protein-disulfide isomerase
VNRRTFLATAAASAGVGLAGCLGGGAESTATAAGGGGSDLQTHDATTGLADQPSLGPAPGEATGTIVAFEDPSCTRCRAFEQQTVPKIRSDLVEPGTATFVLRGYPVVYEWGKPAVQALEATLARDEEAHWALVDHYFDTQDEFSTGNVLDRTEQFLADETDVDAAAVVGDADAEAYDDQVQADLDAGDAGGADGITPTVFLFRDGTYQTKARGSVSFSVVKGALGL